MTDATATKEFLNKLLNKNFTLVVISEGRPLTKAELLRAAGELKRAKGWKRLPTSGSYTTRFSPPEGLLQIQAFDSVFRRSPLD